MLTGDNGMEMFASLANPACSLAKIALEHTGTQRSLAIRNADGPNGCQGCFAGMACRSIVLETLSTSRMSSSETLLIAGSSARRLSSWCFPSKFSTHTGCGWSSGILYSSALEMTGFSMRATNIRNFFLCVELQKRIYLRGSSAFTVTV